MPLLTSCVAAGALLLLHGNGQLSAIRYTMVDHSHVIGWNVAKKILQEEGESYPDQAASSAGPTQAAIDQKVMELRTARLAYRAAFVGLCIAVVGLVAVLVEMATGVLQAGLFTTQESPPLAPAPEDGESAEPTSGTPIEIIGPVEIKQVGDNWFQFAYETNAVCGNGGFEVFNLQSGKSVGRFEGEAACYGPTHGGYPGSTTVDGFDQFDLKPDMPYRVEAWVVGLDESSSVLELSPGAGRATIEFEVRTTG